MMWLPKMLVVRLAVQPLHSLVLPEFLKSKVENFAASLMVPSMQIAARLRETLENLMPQALVHFERMVGINSFSANREGVNELGRFTAECFAPLGFTAEFIASTNPARGNHLVLTRQGKSPRNLALISHLDTVYPPEEEHRNDFRWQIEGDRIYGPGTNDIKGGTIVMWLVLSALEQSAPELFRELTWRLLWNATEEEISPDFGDVCRARFNHDTLAALVFESEGRLGEEHLMVVARKGRGEWRVKVNGRGAHAGSMYQQGANAILQLGRIVERIAGLGDGANGLTFNIARVSGGSALNRVPHEAVAEGEFRAFTPDVYARGKAALLALAGQGDVVSPVDGFACNIEIEVTGDSRPWPRNKATDRLADVWCDVGAELGVNVNAEERGGLSDGNLIWDAVPTLDGLGPWGENAHCSERSADGSKVPEFVELSGIIPKALLNTLAILRLVGTPG
jgi:glutamate carboxypeptidase